jgi:NADH dehydrogenase FAD-containing subunit
MTGWNSWLGKKVYLISKNSSHPFTGKVIEVDEQSSSSLIWITIIDKFEKRVTFVTSEILSIKEEE